MIHICNHWTSKCLYIFKLSLFVLTVIKLCICCRFEVSSQKINVLLLNLIYFKKRKKKVYLLNGWLWRAQDAVQTSWHVGRHPYCSCKAKLGKQGQGGIGIWVQLHICGLKYIKISGRWCTKYPSRVKKTP